jgi:hypothetical protein
LWYVIDMKTYADVINLLEASKEKVYVAVIYPSGRWEWLPVDKEEYLRQLKMISNAADVPYPCRFEIERSGEMFIHPKVENT